MVRDEKRRWFHPDVPSYPSGHQRRSQSTLCRARFRQVRVSDIPAAFLSKAQKEKAASRRLSLAAGRSQRSNYFLTAEAAALAASTAAPAAALAESPAALAASTAAPAAEAAAAAAGAAAAAAPDAAATAPEAAAAAASAAGAAAGAGAGAAAGAGAGAGADSSFLPQAARAAAAIRADRTSVLFMMNFLW